jgi:hypothetical protein
MKKASFILHSCLSVFNSSVLTFDIYHGFHFPALVAGVALALSLAGIAFSASLPKDL